MVSPIHYGQTVGRRAVMRVEGGPADGDHEEAKDAHQRVLQRLLRAVGGGGGGGGSGGGGGILGGGSDGPGGGGRGRWGHRARPIGARGAAGVGVECCDVSLFLAPSICADPVRSKMPNALRAIPVRTPTGSALGHFWG